MKTNKLLVLAASVLVLAACDYPPFISSSEPVDEKQQKTEMVDNFTYQSNVRVTRKLSDEEKEDFLTKCFNNTIKVKQHNGYGRIFYAEFDRNFYAPEDYYFTENTTFYDDGVYEINYDVFNMDTSAKITEFIRDGHEYHYSYAGWEDEGEYCYKLATSKEDFWHDNNSDTTFLTRYLFDEDEFDIGYTKDGELIGVRQREYHDDHSKIDTADILVYVPSLDREQYIYTFEECEDGYRIKTVTYYDQRQVKFDFETKEETKEYHDRELEKFYFELDYDTEVGSYDANELEYLMTIAVLEDK